MKQFRIVIGPALVLVALTLVQFSRADESTSAAGPHQVTLTPDEIRWKPFPALGPGIQLAILSGDPIRRSFQVMLALRIPRQDAGWCEGSSALASGR